MSLSGIRLSLLRRPVTVLAKFDEPLSNLDAELRVEMRLRIAQLHKQLDAIMIYVTHDQVEAMTMADKIVVLKAGYVEQAGSPQPPHRRRLSVGALPAHSGFRQSHQPARRDYISVISDGSF